MGKLIILTFVLGVLQISQQNPIGCPVVTQQQILSNFLPQFLSEVPQQYYSELPQQFLSGLPPQFSITGVSPLVPNGPPQLSFTDLSQQVQSACLPQQVKEQPQFIYQPQFGQNLKNPLQQLISQPQQILVQNVPQPIIPNLIEAGPIATPSCSNQISQFNPQLLSQLLPQNVVATTVIDNTICNSLASALQLLIVSDLIESTTNCPKPELALTPVGYETVSPVCEVGPVYEISAPISEYVQPISESFVYQDCGCANQLYQYPQYPCYAEVIIPSSIPAQLNCNFCYAQTSSPVVNFNVEALPFDLGSYDCGYFY